MADTTGEPLVQGAGDGPFPVEMKDGGHPCALAGEIVKVVWEHWFGWFTPVPHHLMGRVAAPCSW